MFWSNGPFHKSALNPEQLKRLRRKGGGGEGRGEKKVQNSVTFGPRNKITKTSPVHASEFTMVLVQGTMRCGEDLNTTTEPGCIR